MRLLPENGLPYNGDGDPSSAQTERLGGAGPVRGILGSKTSPAALVFLLFMWDGFANRPALLDGSQNRPTLQPPSKIAG
jgi:hypothetical protein